MKGGGQDSDDEKYCVPVSETHLANDWMDASKKVRKRFAGKPSRSTNPGVSNQAPGPFYDLVG